MVCVKVIWVSMKEKRQGKAVAQQQLPGASTSTSAHRVPDLLGDIWIHTQLKESLGYLQSEGMPLTSVANQIGVDVRTVFRWLDEAIPSDPIHILLVQLLATRVKATKAMLREDKRPAHSYAGLYRYRHVSDFNHVKYITLKADDYENMSEVARETCNPKAFKKSVEILQNEGIPLTRIAERIGTNWQNIYRWMNGTRPRTPYPMLVVRMWADELREKKVTGSLED